MALLQQQQQQRRKSSLKLNNDDDNDNAVAVCGRDKHCLRVSIAYVGRGSLLMMWKALCAAMLKPSTANSASPTLSPARLAAKPAMVNA